VADKHASAIYLSTAAGGADAIAAQRRACNEYAQRNGLRSVAEFSDTGSGLTVRPGLRALLDGLDDPGREWGSVVAFRPDRFGRSHEVVGEVVGRCQAAGVELLTAVT
jgi:DNA invertase Pin-like site-specific DNA recombinase